MSSAIALTSRTASALDAPCSRRACRRALGRRALRIAEDRVDRALADPEPPTSTPLMRLCAVNGMNLRAKLGDVAAADAVLLLGEHDDRAPFGRLVGERGELRRVGQLRLGHAAQRPELGRLAVAEGDRAGLVEEQRVDVAGRLDRAPRHGEHVEAHQPVHAGDADRREKRADGGRDQATKSATSTTIGMLPPA